MNNNKVKNAIKNILSGRKSEVDITSFTFNGLNDSIIDIDINNFESDFQIEMNEARKSGIEIKTIYRSDGFCEILAQDVIREDGLFLEIYKTNNFVKTGVKMFLECQSAVYENTLDPFADPDIIQTESFKQLFAYIDQLSMDEVIKFIENITSEQIKILISEYEAQIATKGVTKTYEI